MLVTVAPTKSISAMKLGASKIIPQLHPFFPPPHSLRPAIAAARRSLALNLRRPNRLISHLSQPHTTLTDDYGGIPIKHVKTLAKFKSLHNYIRVLQVSRAADHPLAGYRLLLLDAPGNIHSISHQFKTLTDAYYDVFATLPPVIPPGPVAILGFGAGSAARIILELHPDTVIHGWELDPSVISVAREYFGLERLEKKHEGRLFIHTGDALHARVNEGFAGIIVDLFGKGRVIPELQDPATWKRLKGSLRKGGRVMVNVGGSCVEPEDSRKDGSVIMEETLEAMEKVFPGEVHVLSIEDREDDSSVAMTGELPESGEWKKALTEPLKLYVDMWEPYEKADRIAS